MHSALACLDNHVVRDAVAAGKKISSDMTFNVRDRFVRWLLAGALRYLEGGTRVRGCLGVSLAGIRQWYGRNYLSLQFAQAEAESEVRSKTAVTMSRRASVTIRYTTACNSEITRKRELHSHGEAR